jgi:hypothetical protein
MTTKARQTMPAPVCQCLRRRGLSGSLQPPQAPPLNRRTLTDGSLDQPPRETQ